MLLELKDVHKSFSEKPVLILIVSAVLIGVLSAKIYRAGVLIYGTRPKAGALIKTVLLAK